MPDTVIKKRSLVIDGHKTSISMEPEFWEAYKAMCAEKGVELGTFAAQIDKARKEEQRNLSSALRVETFKYFDRRTAA